ncbi:hypothetical protein M1563_02085 [Patescibacteria group bacterium]|nr:hypothetical protein [Patescibacteria group bacterium]MCL5409529.1 hypothetical protein [Patescibacteria group bacterium]
MSKLAYIVIAVVVIILIGAGAFLYTKKIKSPTNTQPENTMMQNPAPTESQNQTMTGTLKDLLTMSQPQVCTYSNNSDNSSMSGTAYVAGGKMRGDFSTSTGTSNMSGHVIVDGNNSYIWTDGSTTGFKMTINQTVPTTTPSPSNQTANLNQQVTYSCSAWTEDSSKFNLPTDINFTTMALPTGSASASGSVPGTSSAKSACDVCNSLPTADAQSACKAQLNCQ